MESTKISSNFEILLSQKLTFNCSITIDENKLTEVSFYTRDFTTKESFKLVNIKINIPFVGNSAGNKNGALSRNRILTYIDDELACDSSITSNTEWNLQNLNIDGFITDLKPGKHTLRIKACVNFGTLYIPFLNKSYEEYTINPPLSCGMLITGFN